MNILTGTCYGATQADLLLTARAIAATYFEVDLNQIRVELSDEQFAPRRGVGMDNRDLRFMADFKAEVI